MLVKTPNLLERQKDASKRPQRRRKLLDLSTSAVYQVTSIPGRERVGPTVTLDPCQRAGM